MIIGKVLTRVLPKIVRWRRAKKGKLTNEETAENAETEVAEVEAADTEPTKENNSSQSEYREQKNFRIQLIVSVVTALLSTLLVLFTLFEMRAERNLAYQPSISLGRAQVALAWNADSTLNDAPCEDLMAQILKNKNDETQLNAVPKFRMYNIGAGNAKEAKVVWDYVANANNYVSVLNQRNYKIAYSGDTYIVHDGYYGQLTSDEFYGFILNSPENGETLALPDGYFYLIKLLAESQSTAIVGEYSFPAIQLTIEYKDIQNKNYKTQVSLSVQIQSAQVEYTGEGYCIIDIIPSYIKATKLRGKLPRSSFFAFLYHNI